MILVWRRKVGGDELLQVVDGKGWRLPYATEVGLRRHPVPIERSGYDVAHAWLSDPT